MNTCYILVALQLEREKSINKHHIMRNHQHNAPSEIVDLVFGYIKLNISEKQKERMNIPVQFSCGISFKTFTIKVQEIEMN